MTIATPEEIRWCVESFPRDKHGGYPLVPGAVKGSRTSEAAARFIDPSIRWTNVERAYGYLWNRPNREGCRWEIDDFLESYGHDHGGIRRGRDLVLRGLAYETGEIRVNPRSKQKQEVLRAIGEPVQPGWGDHETWRAVAEAFHHLNRHRKKAVVEILQVIKDW